MQLLCRDQSRNVPTLMPIYNSLFLTMLGTSKNNRCPISDTCCTNSFAIFYSVLKLFTGLANAAFIAWKLTVNSAIIIAANAAATNTHQLILTLYAKLCSHLLMAQYDNGNAITQAMHTSFKNSFESSKSNGR